MSKKLKNIIQEIFVEQKIDALQKTEKEIKEFLGKGFIDKHINKMYLQKNNIIIETKIILTTPFVIEKSIGVIFLTFLSLS